MYAMPKWNDETIVSELEKIKQQIGHFPLRKEISDLGRNDLLGGIAKNGGLNRFRTLMGYELKKLHGYWTKDTDEKCITELQQIVADIGHFPLYEELRPMGKGGLAKAISKSGGINKYRELFGIPFVTSPAGFRTKERCISELEEIIKSIGHFPLQTELKKLDRQDLLGAIDKNGGLNLFRELMSYKTKKVSNGFWTDDKIIVDLQKIMVDIDHFPSQDELAMLGRTDLTNAIQKHGGLNRFRKLMGYEYIKVPKDFWTKERSFDELKRISEIVGHFPSHEEISIHGKRGFGGNIICKYGGINSMRETMGFPSLNISELHSYYSRHGKKAETIILEILNEYCLQRNIELPKKNVKLTNGNIIEFVCNASKKVGIDVTITKRKYEVAKKWFKKDYYKHLDELWIVVINNSFSDEDYIELKNKSPKNVYIYSIEDFCKELQHDLDISMKNKIDKYKKCNFHERS